MEKYTMFMDWKNQYSENEYTPQNNLYLVCRQLEHLQGIIFALFCLFIFFSFYCGGSFRKRKMVIIMECRVCLILLWFLGIIVLIRIFGNIDWATFTITSGKLSSFYEWVVFHCMYLFIHWWTVRLFPCLGCSKWSLWWFLNLLYSERGH